MDSGMDNTRYDFWKWYTKEFKEDFQNRFSAGPQPFRNVEETIFQQIVNDLIVDLDRIIAPAIVCFLEKNKIEKQTGIYSSLFYGQHEETLMILEKFCSPVMINVINRCRRFRLHFYKTTERIFNDWNEIKSHFFINDDDKLTAIKFTCGDEHFNGEQTSIVYFNNKEKGFVYKPISLNLDSLMHKLKARFLTSSDKNLIISKKSGQQEYGYIGLYKHVANVSSLTEAASLYKNFGKLIAWGKFFKITDGHYDNIIVSDEGIQWIDMESAFHFTQESVYTIHPLQETGLICEAKPENTYAGIISGLQGGTIPRLALTSPVIYNDGSDNMYIRYFKLFTPVQCNNRFSFNNVLCNPEDFIEDIKEGYIQCLNILHKNRGEILAIIENFFHNNILKCRYLIQTTASYARFISLTNHIVAIQNNDVLNVIKSEREKTLVGKEFKIKDFIIENEVIDLVDGIIPYFYRTNKSRALYHASGAFRRDFFSNTLFEDIKNHILSINIDEASIQDDCRFIVKALNTTKGIKDFNEFKNKFEFDVFDFDNQLNQL